MDAISDGGSECSYESVPSEGGYHQTASERGRDPVPRIVSASYCVEVFRRMRWSDATYCGRQPSSDNKENGTNHSKSEHSKRKGKQKAGEKESLVDPFCGLPTRLMRFDGAMEAWLEELPLPREPRRRFIPYTELNDAADRFPSELSCLKAGNRRATLWYFSPEFLQQLWPLFFLPNAVGLELWVQMLTDQHCTVHSTHVALGEINVPKPMKSQALWSWLKSVFSAMQTAKWTPDGEARNLLLKRRLTHAGMSIGDAIQVDNDLFVVALDGFIKVKEAPQILPPPKEGAAEGQPRGKKSGRQKGGKEKGQWKHADGPPKDRRSLRAELQRARAAASGKGDGNEGTNGVGPQAGGKPRYNPPPRSTGHGDEYDDEDDDEEEWQA